MLYCVAAAILGIILVVGPLFALAMFRNESSAVPVFLRSEGLKELEKETYGSDTYSYSNFDVGILVLCFFIALTVYLIFKRRSPYSENVWFRYLY